MSLKEYESLDLTKRSDPANDLFDRIATESTHSTIVLTPVYSTDGTPALLTQEMSAWFHSFILPCRSGAIEDVHDEFKRRNLKLFEQEADKIEQKKLGEIASERALLRQNKRVELLRARFIELSSQYDTWRLNYGRDALVWNPFLYWTALVLFMLPEFLINWDSFLKIPGFTPAYATGLMLVVAVAFGFSAHSMGRIIKQWKELFGGHVDFAERRKATRELIIATLLFLIAITAVGWGRWFFIQGAILEKTILRGGSGLELSDLVQFVGAMLGNILVYLLGFLWSLIRHDSVPDFCELRHELTGVQNKVVAAFNKYLTRRNQQHLQKGQKELTQAQRFEDSQKKRDGYPQARQQFSRLKNKDSEVRALLMEYRNRLLTKLKSDQTQRSFQVDDVRVAEMDIVIKLSPDQYASVPIELRYN
jgi:hypothetical protein